MGKKTCVSPVSASRLGTKLKYANSNQADLQSTHLAPVHVIKSHYVLFLY